MLTHCIWQSLYSLPKKNLFLCCISFGEECRSVNFGPNIISAMLLVPIYQKSHPKIPYSYHTLIRCLSTSHCRKITKVESFSKFRSCLSFLDYCILGDLGSYIIPPGLLPSQQKYLNGILLISYQCSLGISWKMCTHNILCNIFLPTGILFCYLKGVIIFTSICGPQVYIVYRKGPQNNMINV